MCVPAIQEIEPVAVAQECCGFRETIAAETDGITVGRMDFDSVKRILQSPVAAIAFAHKLDIMDRSIDLETKRNGKRCRERPPALPSRCKGIGDIKQQRRKLGLTIGIPARRQ